MAHNPIPKPPIQERILAAKARIRATEQEIGKEAAALNISR